MSPYIISTSSYRWIFIIFKTTTTNYNNNNNNGTKTIECITGSTVNRSYRRKLFQSSFRFPKETQKKWNTKADSLYIEKHISRRFIYKVPGYGQEKRQKKVSVLQSYIKCEPKGKQLQTDLESYFSWNVSRPFLITSVVVEYNVENITQKKTNEKKKLLLLVTLVFNIPFPIPSECVFSKS